MKKLILKILGYFKRKHITNSTQAFVFSKTRDIVTPQTRDIKDTNSGIGNVGSQIGNISSQDSEPLARTISVHYPLSEPLQAPSREDMPACAYCSGRDVVKRGTRKKKYEIAQLYLCRHCNKTFVAPKAKGKSFPLKIILEAISYYNTGFTLAESCRFLKEKSGLDVKEASLSNWLKEYEELCRYSRMREYGLKLYSPHQVIQTVNLYHRQVYEFSYHRAKTAIKLKFIEIMKLIEIDWQKRGIDDKVCDIEGVRGI